MMLAFCIEYLSGHAYAADYWDCDRAEWPPHPARFFSALMDACYAADLQKPGLDALRWLEQQGPPALAASEAHERRATTVYVPINDPPTATVLPAMRPKRPRSFPCVIPEDPRVYLIWGEAVPEAATRTLLASMAAHVTALGSARSLPRQRVRGDAGAAPDGRPTLGPHRDVDGHGNAPACPAQPRWRGRPGPAPWP